MRKLSVPNPFLGCLILFDQSECSGPWQSYLRLLHNSNCYIFGGRLICNRIFSDQNLISLTNTSLDLYFLKFGTQILTQFPSVTDTVFWVTNLHLKWVKEKHCCGEIGFTLVICWPPISSRFLFAGPAAIGPRGGYDPLQEGMFFSDGNHLSSYLVLTITKSQFQIACN